MGRKLIKEWKYKAGYVVREERFSGMDYGVPENESFNMKSAFTFNDEYIGEPRDAYRLIVKRGIKPEYRTEHSQVCSIGFCERDQKWYGWSHRAICGFGIGDMVFEEVLEGSDDHTPFVQHGTKRIETLEDARQTAANFAAYVS